MSVNREELILKELDAYKWSNGQFICLKCSNKSYIKGDELFSRKCSKCKKNVSLIKYTAFEGLRFPLEKAIGIIDTIVAGDYLDPSAKVIPPIKKRNNKDLSKADINNIEEKNPNPELEYISMNDILRLAKERRWSSDRLNDELVKANERYKPTINSLAKKYELQENTVKKFVGKIGDRIISDYRGTPDNFLERILFYLRDRPRASTSHFLGMAMVPLVGDWRYGLAKIGGKGYGIKPVEDDGGPWSVFRMTGEKDNSRYNWNYHEEIIYGSDEWYQLFHVNIDN